MLTPFDLHVLSTPPAFILSQDQTLLFWFAFPPGFPRFLKAFCKTEIFRSYSKLNLAFPFLLLLLGLFRSFFFFLWNHSAVFTACFTARCFHPSALLMALTASEYFQGCITVYLSRFSSFLCFTRGSLSSSLRRQLCYLITYCSLCQALFSTFLHFFSTR